MKIGKAFLPAIFGLMACLLSFAPARALESIIIAYPTTSSQFTPLWFTRDVGLYEKYGLDGKLVFIQGGSVLLQAMLAGQVQASQNGVAETATAILRGGDLRMLGVTAKIFLYSFDRRQERQKPQGSGRGQGRHQSHRRRERLRLPTCLAQARPQSG